jgi:short-subunit dehydrogenase
MTMGFAAETGEVARDVVQALERRRFLVRPALLSKLLEASLKPLPRFLRTRILGKIMAGMTRGESRPQLAAKSAGT